MVIHVESSMVYTLQRQFMKQTLQMSFIFDPFMSKKTLYTHLDTMNNVFMHSLTPNDKLFQIQLCKYIFEGSKDLFIPFTIYDKRMDAIKLIQRMFRRANTDPSYQLCRRRLLYEFNHM